MHPPHDHKHLLGHFHKGDASHVQMAIKAAMEAKKEWQNMSWENRASIFLRAASLLAGKYRQKINAATMIGQSKNPYQAEIDAACELVDFFRFNVHYMTEIYSQQPISGEHMWNDSIAELVARVEAHLESNPDDGKGWELLAPVYARAERYTDALKARRNALRLLGANAEREAGLGEALTGAAGGVVTAEAKVAFERALSLDPKEYRARYYLGLAAEQDGRKADAAAIWQALLAGVPADLPLADFLRQSLARVDPAAAATAAPPQAPRGPSAEDVAAAAELSPEQRTAMVRGMVERLADRLKQESTDVEGWLRLLRAYMVLGEPDKARGAAGDARRALTGEPDKLQRIDELVKRLGLDG
jgi:cytochrome c-type biogenesis protein CcmH/NrfG